MLNNNAIPEGPLDLRYLRYASAAAHGSFRKPAETLDISQSAVIRRIQSLEARLGSPLFERSRNGVKPTCAGSRFLREASFAVRHIRKALNEIALAQRGEIGALRIGLTVSLAGGPRSDLLDSYHRRFPNIVIRLAKPASVRIA
jgi:DNA-binding transcriptional LysR family regulator